MLNAAGKVLYVGKAKNLKKRVVAYTQIEKLPNRLKRMVNETRSMEIVTTASETEALLLESNLIKKLQPRYNVLLKDDKSFPYILLTAHEFPRILKYRGPKIEKGDYFGPFANVAAVDETIIALQKIFYVRNCADTVFNERTRPCLQYDIKRCTAPCVNKISKDEYREFIDAAKLFLQGKSDEVQRQFAKLMHEASDNLNFERAVKYRDSIKLLTQIQAKQRINVAGVEHADVFALSELNGKFCVQGFFFRHGRNYGAEIFDLSHTEGATASELISAFLNQFYVEHEPAQLVLCNVIPEELDILLNSLKTHYQNKITLEIPTSGVKLELVDHALKNAQESLQRRFAEELSNKKQLEQLQDFIEHKIAIETIEVYDNSHLQGTSPYGVCIAANAKGFDKNRYRKFSLDKYPGETRDDFAMMAQVMQRRLSHKDECPLPDLFLIDGGDLQINAVNKILQEYGVSVPAVGIAKGKKRNAYDETFYFADGSTKKLPASSSLLYFLQRIRDEAHRFAIGSHRAGRAKQLVKSKLDEIPGIGGKRKKLLLQHFGSSGAVARASIQDLMVVSGVSKSVAETIYYFFHQD
jgi:excinuclease ABC subunit C